MRRLRVLTWHVHGNYLLYLARAGVDFYLPVKQEPSEGFGGRGATFSFDENVRDIPADAVRELAIDCVLYQTRRNYEVDGPEILSDAQRKLPHIYLQHDPPWDDPVNEVHWSDDPDGLLVHVTPFNALMWDSGRTPSRVIDHGVFVPSNAWFTGELARGLVVINHLRQRGRRLGSDVFQWMRDRVPLDLVGMDAESLGGIGEVFPAHLPHFAANYRFFFNPIRWTSLGLAVIEAMMVGLPVVGLATTELAAVIENGVCGFVDTDMRKLVEPMQYLIAEPDEAQQLGENARRYAQERFGIERFSRDWETAFADVCGRPVRERVVESSGFVGAAS